MLQTYITKNTQPYRNLALEEYLMETVPENAVTLYLWQNRRTVVAGRNQNAWRECRVAELEADGGYFARRLSGGGAVFHDLGNLNFTFLARKKNYDVARQLEVVLDAARRLGISAEKSGRNDITVQGRKFSGNAFYQSGEACYHHGTLLVNADIAALSRYLTVPPEKLKSKGVESVRARVANLAEFCPALTVEGVKTAMLAAFGGVYGEAPVTIAECEIDWERVKRLTEKFSSWEWRFGGGLEFQFELSRRFPWGGIQLQFVLECGKVKEAALYSDAMNAPLVSAMPALLRGCPFAPAALANALAPLLQGADEADAVLVRGVQALLREECP